MQLDISTLSLMFITQGFTSFLVMYLIWRINRNLPGVQFWMYGTLLNIFSSLTMLLNAQLGWADGWGAFVSNSISLPANLLVMEGSLRFMGYHSRRRWNGLLLLIPVFIIGSWINRLDPAPRYIFHDSFTMTFSLVSAVVLLWGAKSREERTANLLASVSGILLTLTIGWRLLLAVTGNHQIMQGVESPATQWYLFSAVTTHIAWIFGLSVACYYRSRLQVLQLAREDALTGLPNRRSIDELLGQSLIDQRRSDERFAVIMIDINNFKQVNDNFGHSAGDFLLREVADRLQSAIRESDFAGRLGGDEFVVRARYIDTAKSLEQFIDRIRSHLNGPLSMPSGVCHVEVSVGAALCPDDGVTADQLLGAADTRMYRDKNRLKKP
jgi:diguanylate cyclase